jgi:hypothetical protein
VAALCFCYPLNNLLAVLTSPQRSQSTKVRPLKLRDGDANPDEAIVLREPLGAHDQRGTAVVAA